MPKTKRTKRFHYVQVILMLIIIALGLLFMMMQVLPVQTRIKYIGFQPMVILTDSMSGELEQGDFIVVKKVNVKDLLVGDIISFYVDLNNDGKKEIVTHYIANIEVVDNRYTFQTKPKVVDRVDVWTIDEDDIVGELCLHIPKVGKLLANSHIRVGTGLIISIVAFSLAICIATTPIQEDYISDEND